MIIYRLAEILQTSWWAEILLTSWGWYITGSYPDWTAVLDPSKVLDRWFLCIESLWQAACHLVVGSLPCGCLEKVAKFNRLEFVEVVLARQFQAWEESIYLWLDDEMDLFIHCWRTNSAKMPRTLMLTEMQYSFWPLITETILVPKSNSAGSNCCLSMMKIYRRFDLFFWWPPGGSFVECPPQGFTGRWSHHHRKEEEALLSRSIRVAPEVPPLKLGEGGVMWCLVLGGNF